MKSLTRKLLGFLIAPIGSFTIIGTGFAVWQFDGVSSGSSSLTENGIELNVTKGTSDGELKIVKSPHLIVLSQGSNDTNNLFDGITFYSRSQVSGADEISANTTENSSTENIADGENTTEDSATNTTTNSNDYEVTFPDDTFSFRYYTKDKDMLDETFLSNAGLQLNLGINFSLTSTTKVDEAGNVMEGINDFLAVSDTLTSNCRAIKEGDIPESVLTDNKIKNTSFFFVDDKPVITSELSFKKTTGTETESVNGLTETIYYIQIDLSLNVLFRYKDASHKPSSYQSYKNLADAMSGASWEVSAEVVAFYSNAN